MTVACLPVDVQQKAGSLTLPWPVTSNSLKT